MGRYDGMYSIIQPERCEWWSICYFVYTKVLFAQTVLRFLHKCDQINGKALGKKYSI